MSDLINTLFLEFLSNQDIARQQDYMALSKAATQKELQLHALLDTGQAQCYDALLELTAQLHYLEVRDAFVSGCKAGIQMRDMLSI